LRPSSIAAGVYSNARAVLKLNLVESRECIFTIRWSWAIWNGFSKSTVEAKSGQQRVASVGVVSFEFMPG
jgi:hypothetical protein